MLATVKDNYKKDYYRLSMWLKWYKGTIRPFEKNPTFGHEKIGNKNICQTGVWHCMSNNAILYYLEKSMHSKRLRESYIRAQMAFCQIVWNYITPFVYWIFICLDTTTEHITSGSDRSDFFSLSVNFSFYTYIMS